jgi:predicted AAA+ superfamily ATPase
MASNNNPAANLVAFTSVLADMLSLSVFAGLKEQSLFTSLRTLLADIAGGGWDFSEDDGYGNSDFDGDASQGQLSWPDLVQDWAAFTSSLLQYGSAGFTACITSMVSNADNSFTHSAEADPEHIPPLLGGMAKSDLNRLGRIAGLELHNLGFYVAEVLRRSGLEVQAQNVEEEGRVLWSSSVGLLTDDALKDTSVFNFPTNVPWGTALPQFAAWLHKRGAGILGTASSFVWIMPPPPAADDDFSLPPAPLTPPPYLWPLVLRPGNKSCALSLEDLEGYEAQRSVVMANTRRFLEHGKANNLLLYGARGTGKSATVKAVARAFADKGLKLIEVRKEELEALPIIVELLAQRKLPFIIFHDDLSFESADDSFRGFKSFLEGGIDDKPSNVLIYATANRRRMVKDAASNQAETDGMQEEFSLADRFGLTVVFNSPEQDEYLSIACHIARRRGILGENDDNQKIEDFKQNALRWAKCFNGCSPRTAVQFVDWVEGGTDFPWK